MSVGMELRPVSSQPPKVSILEAWHELRWRDRIGAVGSLVALALSCYLTGRATSDTETIPQTPPAAVAPGPQAALNAPTTTWEGQRVVTDPCQAITLNALRQALNESGLSDAGVCTTESSGMLAFMRTETNLSYGRFDFPRGHVESVEIQVVDDTAVSKTSLFGNIGKFDDGSYDDECIDCQRSNTISEYPAKFFQVQEDETQPNLMTGVTIVQIPTSSGGAIDVLMATRMATGVSTSEPGVAAAVQESQRLGLANLIPTLVQGANGP